MQPSKVAETEEEFKQNVKCRAVGRPTSVPVPVVAEHTKFRGNLGKPTALHHC